MVAGSLRVPGEHRMENTVQKEEIRVRPEESALARATRLIAEDAQIDAPAYLAHSLVPKGGE